MILFPDAYSYSSINRRKGKTKIEPIRPKIDKIEGICYTNNVNF